MPAPAIPQKKANKKNILCAPSKYTEIHILENAHICRGRESFTISPKNATFKSGFIRACDRIKKANTYLAIAMVFSLLPIKNLGKYTETTIQNAAKIICEGANKLKASASMFFN